MSKTKVVYKKLRTVYGYAYIHQNKIAIWEALKQPKYAKKHLEILIHEKLHLLYPDLDEKAVKRDGKQLSDFLWDQGCRIKKDM